MCPVDPVSATPPVYSPGVVTLGDDGLPGLVERADLNPTTHCNTVGEVEGRASPAINIVVGTVEANRLPNLTRYKKRIAGSGAVVIQTGRVQRVAVKLPKADKIRYRWGLLQ